jgi:hypothetical protein
MSSAACRNFYKSLIDRHEYTQGLWHVPVFFIPISRDLQNISLCILTGCILCDNMVKNYGAGHNRKINGRARGF